MYVLIKKIFLFIMFCVSIVGSVGSVADVVYEDRENEFLTVKSLLYVRGEITGANIHSGGVLYFDGTSKGQITVKKDGILILLQSFDFMARENKFSMTIEDGGYVGYLNGDDEPVYDSATVSGTTITVSDGSKVIVENTARSGLSAEHRSAMINYVADTAKRSGVDMSVRAYSNGSFEVEVTQPAGAAGVKPTESSGNEDKTRTGAGQKK